MGDPIEIAATLFIHLTKSKDIQYLGLLIGQANHVMTPLSEPSVRTAIVACPSFQTTCGLKGIKQSETAQTWFARYSFGFVAPAAPVPTKHTPFP